MAAGPGPLEVIAAEVAGDVDDFSNKVKAGRFAGFEGLGGKFAGIHAAERDFGFFVADRSARADAPVMEACGDFAQAGYAESFW